MKINMIKIIMLALVVTALSSCGGGNGSEDSITGTGKESNQYSYIPDRLDTGESCFPIKINNKSKVLLGCSLIDSEVIPVIWSEEEGLKFLPGEVPQVFAAEPNNLKLSLYPADLSDDGKVTFNLFLRSSSFVGGYTESPVSYVHDGQKYVPISGSLAVMSPNGKYIVTLGESKYNIYKDFEKIELPDLSGLGEIYQISGINNDGVVVGSTFYSDLEHSFSGNYAVTFSKDGGRLLPPPVRPDININQAQAINSNGDILMLVNEVLDTPIMDSFGGFQNYLSRLYVVRVDDSFVEISPPEDDHSNISFSISDNSVVVFDQRPFLDLTNNNILVYQEDKGVKQLKDSIDLMQGESLEWYVSGVNDKNEMIISVITESGSKARIAKIK
jgi:hypothetical protein